MEINAVLIKKYRKQNGLSQAGLAELLGVSWRTIQNYESGGTIPKSKHIAIRNIVSNKKMDITKGNQITNFLHPDGSKVTFNELAQYVSDNFEAIIKTPALEKPVRYFKLEVINSELKEIMKDYKK